MSYEIQQPKPVNIPGQRSKVQEYASAGTMEQHSDPLQAGNGKGDWGDWARAGIIAGVGAAGILGAGAAIKATQNSISKSKGTGDETPSGTKEPETPSGNAYEEPSEGGELEDPMLRYFETSAYKEQMDKDLETYDKWNTEDITQNDGSLNYSDLQVGDLINGSIPVTDAMKKDTALIPKPITSVTRNGREIYNATVSDEDAKIISHSVKCRGW